LQEQMQEQMQGPMQGPVQTLAGRREDHARQRLR
jgi:hypothetical protein